MPGASDGGPELSVVIPVHDERETLRELHGRLTDAVGGGGLSYELLFVDDGSSDGSTDLLRELVREDPCVRVYVLARRSGQLAATLCGLARAGGKRVVTIDADLAHPPEAVPRLLAALRQGHDVAVAVRQGEGAPGPASRLGRGFLRWVFGVRVPRDLSTFRAFRGEVARELAERAGRAVLLGAEVCRLGARIGYVPVAVGPRARGRSKHTLAGKVRVWLAAAATYGVLPWRLLLFPLAKRGGGPPYEVREILSQEEGRAGD